MLRQNSKIQVLGTCDGKHCTWHVTDTCSIEQEKAQGHDLCSVL